MSGAGRPRDGENGKGPFVSYVTDQLIAEPEKRQAVQTPPLLTVPEIKGILKKAIVLMRRVTIIPVIIPVIDILTDSRARCSNFLKSTFPCVHWQMVPQELSGKLRPLQAEGSHGPLPHRYG